MAKLKGADVSKWQGDINWTLFRTAIEFCIIRSSYGTGYTDAKFARNRDEARRAGLLRGFYHYAYPQYNTPQAEADWFLKVLGQVDDGDILVLDIEEPYSQLVSWSKVFLDRIAERLDGYKPLIYLNQAQIKGNDWKPIIQNNNGLWLAQYDYNFDGTPVSTPWPVVAMRQYSNRETFPGISGGVDANVFYGDRAAYLKYGYKKPIQPEPTPPPSTIEKLPKDVVIRDILNGLCTSTSDDEVKAYLARNINIREIVEDVCAGNDRFFERWVKPNIPAPSQDIVITKEEKAEYDFLKDFFTKLKGLLGLK